MAELLSDFQLGEKQKLCCNACGDVFTDIYPAIDHVISCSKEIKKPIKPKKRYKQDENFDSDFHENEAGKIIWTQHAVANLLNCIYQKVEIYGSIHNDPVEMWNTIEIEMKPLFPVATKENCEDEWNKIKLRAKVYGDVTNLRASIGYAPTVRPLFYSATHILLREIEKVRLRSLGEIEQVSQLEEEDRPSTIMDSNGQTYSTEILLEVLEAVEAGLQTEDEIAQKFEIPVEVVNWVGLNGEIVTKGTISCSTCLKHIPKEKFLEHELQCAIEKENRDINSNTHEYWNHHALEVLLNMILKKSSTYFDKSGELNYKFWTKVAADVRYLRPDVTPEMLNMQWLYIIKLCKQFDIDQKATGEETVEKPQFYDKALKVSSVSSEIKQNAGDQPSDPESPLLDTKEDLSLRSSKSRLRLPSEYNFKKKPKVRLELLDEKKIQKYLRRPVSPDFAYKFNEDSGVSRSGRIRKIPTRFIEEIGSDEEKFSRPRQQRNRSEIDLDNDEPLQEELSKLGSKVASLVDSQLEMQRMQEDLMTNFLERSRQQQTEFQNMIRSVLSSRSAGSDLSKNIENCTS